MYQKSKFKSDGTDAKKQMKTIADQWKKEP